MTYIFYLASTSYTITAVNINVTITSDTSTTPILQTTQFIYIIQGMKGTLYGDPGYSSGAQLMIGISTGTSVTLASGVSISDSTGTCLENSTTQTPISRGIQIGSDLMVSCIINSKLNLTTYCSNSPSLINLANLERIGIFGNANINDLTVSFMVDNNIY